MKVGIPKLLKKVFGAEPPATSTPSAPTRSRSSTNDAMSAKLARINAAEAKVIAAQSKIDQLTLTLEEAKQKENNAAQTLLAKAKAGEDTRQYTEAQKRAREDVTSVLKSLKSAQDDLVAANEEKAKV